MNNPVLVEVYRGALVESQHRGSISVVDADGATVLDIGDTKRPVFPRSAIKALLAIALVESGAVDALGLEPHELALACASHSGEVEHVKTAASMLQKAGLDVDVLECGCHRPLGAAANVALAETRIAPTALHNNCSGKHSGFICLACHQGVDPKGYVNPDHWVQQRIRGVMEEMTGAAHAVDQCGTDGCSIPTYAVPLSSMALAFARFSTGVGLDGDRAKACKQIYQACVDNPFYVAGTDRACTRIMEAGKGRIFVKTGAEGVYCAAIPELGVGITLKCDDGETRAAETMVATVIANLLPKEDEVGIAIRAIGQPILKNWNGIEVGSIRAAGEIS